jgi:Rho termination factor, N-terminal domain
MNVEVRKSAQGTEYWDTKAKKVRFVPAGQEPGFEVTKEPKSMVKEEEKSKDSNGTQLEDMTVAELKDFAKEVNVEIPSDVKKKEDIIKVLVASKE